MLRQRKGEGEGEKEREKKKKGRVGVGGSFFLYNHGNKYYYLVYY